MKRSATTTQMRDLWKNVWVVQLAVLGGRDLDSRFSLAWVPLFCFCRQTNSAVLEACRRPPTFRGLGHGAFHAVPNRCPERGRKNDQTLKWGCKIHRTGPIQIEDFYESSTFHVAQ
jgi:hypothetical protein